MKKKKFRDRIITTSDLPDVLPDERPDEKLTIVTTNTPKKKRFTKQILTTADVKKEEKDE